MVEAADIAGAGQDEAAKAMETAQKNHAAIMESVGLTSTTGAAVLAGSAAFALVAAMLQWASPNQPQEWVQATSGTKVLFAT